MPEDVMYFATVELNTDLSQFSNKEKKMLRYLFEAASIMDDVFWKQTYPGDRKSLIEAYKNSPDTMAFLNINYGPWERLGGNKPFVNGYSDKPKGAGFYPIDMTVEEFNALEDTNKTHPYTVIKRNAANNTLRVEWYHEAYKKEFEKAAQLLEKAATLSENESFANYLRLRATALRTSDYYESDMAWVNVKDSKVDFVIGPIEHYEDALFGYKTACESYVLIKDVEWSKKLESIGALLPELQANLPVSKAYKAEVPGSDVDINVYDVIFYQGDCNAGSKTISVNLPNDIRVQLSKGSRRLQLKNTIKYKFDKILVPLSDILITPEQRHYIKFDRFFENVTFREIAQGLGIKRTLKTNEPVRTALKETYSALEEAKADIAGLYMIEQLHKKGKLTEGDILENCVTFFASIFRSVRFGASSAHGRANMLCFNHFLDYGVFSRGDDGFYTLNFEKMPRAVNALAEKILRIQGDGDYAAAKKWLAEKGTIDPVLQSDLDRISAAHIPRDIVYYQGKSVVGL
ncbi:hypothetical protein FACS1894201_02760 [Bacteroidia bacterium]|nr:hypothetical protein FACS1894201_02760 [Bacteroidia bacterium]